MQNDSPPCASCDKPVCLFPANEKAFAIWDLCNRSRDIAFAMNGIKPMKLKNSEIIATRDALMGSREDFEKVISIEEVAYPYIVQEWSQCQG